MPRVIITVPDKTPQPYRFSLDRKVVRMGRGSDNDIVIDSGSVSVQHAEMKRTDGGFEIEDLGSTNGIKCEGKRQMRFALYSGAKVLLGDVEFDFTLNDEEQTELAKEKGPVQPTASGEEKDESNDSVEEDSGEEETKQPTQKRARRIETPKKPTAPTSQLLGSTVMLILFLILAGGAFYAGAEIRHQRDTGEPLLKGIVNKGDYEKKKSEDSESQKD